jgi:predicted nucleic acid-binding protein
VQQSVTSSVVRLYQKHEVVVWWASPVEIASGLARLVRMNYLTPSDCAKARKLAANLGDTWSVIQPSESVRASAVRFVDHYDLRAADSLQLSAALAWCGGAPHGRVFLTADRKLREAAFLAGFDTPQI